MAGQIGGGLGPAAHLQLGEDGRDVVLDRLLGQLQPGADLAVGVSLRDQRQDALLLGRQAGKALVAPQVLALAQALEHGGGAGGVEQALSLTDRADGPDQVAAADLLQDVTTGASHDGSKEGLVICERGEHQYLRVRSLRSDLARRLDAAAISQPDVHHDHVGLRSVRLDYGVLDRARLCHHTDIAGCFEHGLEAAAYDLVVVNQHQAENSLWPLVRGVSSFAWHYRLPSSHVQRVGAVAERPHQIRTFAPERAAQEVTHADYRNLGRLGAS